MAEKGRIAYKAAQRASWDSAFEHKLFQDPVEALQDIEPGLKEDDAKEIAPVAESLIPVLPERQIMKLVNQLFENATRAFHLTVNLSRVLFIAGISIVGAVLVFEIAGRVLGNTSWMNVATTGIIGAIGIGSIVSSFILRPLQNIQNSVGNLSQIQIGFLDFVDRRQILLQTKTSGNITDTKQLSDEIGKAASAAMKLIEDYCEYRTEEKRQG